MVALFEGLTSDAGRPGLRAQHAAIRKALAQADTVVEEALRERKSYLTDSPTRSRWCARSIACATTW